MKQILLKQILCGMALLALTSSMANAVSITGNPLADGWIAGGHSLENGVYVTGSANYGFETYSAGFTVQSGSVLDISDGATSWLVNDNVIAVGGSFQPITAGDAGWGGFSGGAVNALLPAGQNPSSLKLQVKFGTNLATWTTSTTAPGSGNGNSSTSNGGGRVQVRTSGYFGATVLTAGQDEPWTWAGNSGQLLVLDKDDHINWAGQSLPSKYVARMIWNYDAGSGHVSSWELLLNTSLLDRLDPGHLLPSIGDKAILTVQQADGAFTDALVQINAVSVVPVPGAVWLLGSALGLIGWMRRKSP